MDVEILGPEEMRICKFCQRHVGFSGLGENGPK